VFNIPDDVPFMDLASEYLPENDDEDISYIPPPTRPAERHTDDEKALDVLKYMKAKYPRFSLRLLMETIFASSFPALKNYANIFLADGGAQNLMDLWWEGARMRDIRMNAWAVERAALVCAREFGWLSENASKGPHQDDANFLRVSPQKATAAMLQDFSYASLLARYERVTPHFQHILKVAIGKSGRSEHEGSRNPDHVCSVLYTE
jgi:hypothetical protein